MSTITRPASAQGGAVAVIAGRRARHLRHAVGTIVLGILLFSLFLIALMIGNTFYHAMFIENNQGKASAVVVILMLAIVPVMVYQVRQFRKQEESR